jgi:hypothetical protein
MKKNIILVICGIGALMITFILTQTPAVAPEIGCTLEAKICPDGSAVGRTGPNCEFTPCSVESASSPDNLIVIDTPKPYQKIISPVTITRKARGNWFFEASFPITIVNWDGLIIGQGIATANGEWMTTEFVPFTAQISYLFATDTPYDRGAIILKKDNPSGLPEYDDAREIPIIFGEAVLS